MRGTDRGNPATGDLTRRLAFGTVAEQYELIRPGYPGDLITAVLAHCGGPGVAAVEAGAGTGKATRLFAKRGLRIAAVEPDPAMAGILAASCTGYPGVTVVGGLCAAAVKKKWGDTTNQPRGPFR